jgi:hypothetical protein
MSSIRLPHLRVLRPTPLLCHEWIATLKGFLLFWYWNHANMAVPSDGKGSFTSFVSDQYLRKVLFCIYVSMVTK